MINALNTSKCWSSRKNPSKMTKIDGAHSTCVLHARSATPFSNTGSVKRTESCAKDSHANNLRCDVVQNACYFAKLVPLEERRRQTATIFLSKCKTATFYIIYSHHYNVLRLDILSRVNLFAFTQTDLKTLIYSLCSEQFSIGLVKNIPCILCHSNA